jgi:hypothetical protein
MVGFMRQYGENPALFWLSSAHFARLPIDATAQINKPAILAPLPATQVWI